MVNMQAIITKYLPPIGAKPGRIRAGTGVADNIDGTSNVMPYDTDMNMYDNCELAAFILWSKLCKSSSGWVTIDDKLVAETPRQTFKRQWAAGSLYITRGTHEAYVFVKR